MRYGANAVCCSMCLRRLSEPLGCCVPVRVLYGHPHPAIFHVFHTNLSSGYHLFNTSLNDCVIFYKYILTNLVIYLLIPLISVSVSSTPFIYLISIIILIIFYYLYIL